MRVRHGPGDESPPEPPASCDGCDIEGCPECEAYKPCSRGHDRDGDDCAVDVECQCGVESCSILLPGTTCPDCGDRYRNG